MAKISTPITEMFGIEHPIMLAGMNVAAGPKLAATVTNNGGLGVIGGVGYTPKMLRKNIEELKSFLSDPGAPFGVRSRRGAAGDTGGQVDLLLPQVGGSARKTNKDYTHGALPELVDIIIESKAALFVSAVGVPSRLQRKLTERAQVPPKLVVDKLHAAGIPVMNMVGHPKHVDKALGVGVDIICAQGGEGGGHTGDVPTSVLIPKVVDLCRGKMSPLSGKQVPVVAAGGIFDSRGVAASLCFGADAVWVGTRFVASEEAGAPKRHKAGVVKAGYTDTYRTVRPGGARADCGGQVIYTGRPMRIIANPVADDWEQAILNIGEKPG